MLRRSSIFQASSSYVAVERIDPNSLVIENSLVHIVPSAEPGELARVACRATSRHLRLAILSVRFVGLHLPRPSVEHCQHLAGQTIVVQEVECVGADVAFQAARLVRRMYLLSTRMIALSLVHLAAACPESFDLCRPHR